MVTVGGLLQLGAMGTPPCSPAITVPNMTTRQSRASVPIVILLYMIIVIYCIMTEY